MLGLANSVPNLCELISDNPMVFIYDNNGILGTRGKDRLELHLAECQDCYDSYIRSNEGIEWALSAQEGYDCIAQILLPFTKDASSLAEFEDFAVRFCVGANRQLREGYLSNQHHSSFLHLGLLNAFEIIRTGNQSAESFGIWLVKKGYVALRDRTTREPVGLSDRVKEFISPLNMLNDEAIFAVFNASPVITPLGEKRVANRAKPNPLLECYHDQLFLRYRESGLNRYRI